MALKLKHVFYDDDHPELGHIVWWGGTQFNIHDEYGIEVDVFNITNITCLEDAEKAMARHFKEAIEFQVGVL